MLDLIYARTRLLRDAAAIGCTVADGGVMLLHQGAAAFTLWTGQPAPLDLMQEQLAAARAGGLRSAEGEPAEGAEPARSRSRPPAGRPGRLHGEPAGTTTSATGDDERVPIPDRRRIARTGAGRHGRGRAGGPRPDRG